MRARKQLFVLVAALMLVASPMAAPASADVPQGAVSVHDTTSELSAGTLDGWSASDGQLTLTSYSDSYGFDDGTLQGWTGTSNYGSWSASTSRSFEGSHSVSWSDNDQFAEFTGTFTSEQTYAPGFDMEFAWRNNIVTAGSDTSELQYAGWTVRFNHGGASVINSQGSTVASTSSGYPQASWVKVDLEVTQGGQLYFATRDPSGGVHQELTVDAGLTASNDNVVIRKDTGPDAEVDTNVDSVEFREIDPSGGTYTSATHTAQDASGGYVDFAAVENAEVSISWQGYDGSTWTTLAQQTTATAGNKRLSWGDTPYTDIRVVIEATGQSGRSSVVVESEGVLGSTVVGDSHENGTDFSNARQLVNMQVAGSGQSAYVEYSPPSSTTVYDWTTDHRGNGLTATSSAQTYDGTNDRIGIAPANASDWVQNLIFRDDLDGVNQINTWQKVQGDYVGVMGLSAKQEYQSQLDNSEAVNFHIRAPDDVIRVAYNDGGSMTQIDTPVSGLSGTTPYWMHMTVSGDTYTLELYSVASDGTPGSLLGTVETTTTNEPTYWAYEAHKASSNDMYQYQWGYDTSGSTDTGTYLSSNLSVTGSTGGQVDLQAVQNANVNVTWERWTGSSWAQKSTATYTSSGVHTQTWAEASSEVFRVNVTVEPTSGTTVAELDSDAVLFENTAPSVSLAGPAADAQIDSQNVTLEADVSDADLGTAQGESVDVEFRWGNGTLIDTATVTSAQRVSTTVVDPPPGSYSWYVTAADSYTGADTTPIRSFDIVRYDPVIDDSTMSPTGELNESPVNFTVDISDQDFANAGDELTAELWVDGELEGTDTLTSNGEALVQAPAGFGGTVQYHWEVTDSYGNSDTSESRDIKTPGSIEVREALGSHQLLTESNATVEIYINDPGSPAEIVTAAANGGTIDLADVPANSSFVVVASADGYQTRRIFLQSVFEVESVYLPSENATTVRPTFELHDYTTQFPPEDTVLQVQRSINNDWTTVEGDYLSTVNRFTATLLFNERHRLVLYNVETGLTDVRGSFTPTGDGLVTVRVSDAQTETSEAVIQEMYEPLFSVTPDVDSLPASENVTVGVDVAPRNSSLEGYTMTVESGGNVLLERTVNGDASIMNETIDLSGHSGDNATFVFEWNGGGNQGTVEEQYSVGKTYPDRTGLIEALQGLGVGGASGAMLTLVFSVLVVGYTSTRVGAVGSAGSGVAVIAGGGMLGWMPWPVVVVALAAYVVMAVPEVTQ